MSAAARPPHRFARWVSTALALAAATALTAACSPSRRQPAPVTTITSTVVHTITPSPRVVPTGTIDTGALVRTDGTCPIISEAAALPDIGMRLARQGVITRAGRTVGCDFYADQNWPNEHLPGPDQSVLEILSYRYADAIAASNAMVRTSEAGTEAHQADVDSVVGVSYRVRFDPDDGDQDWAYAFTRGSTLVTIRTAQSASELNPREVAADVIGKF